MRFTDRINQMPTPIDTKIYQDHSNRLGVVHIPKVQRREIKREFWRESGKLELATVQNICQNSGERPNVGPATFFFFPRGSKLIDHPAMMSPSASSVDSSSPFCLRSLR